MDMVRPFLRGFGQVLGLTVACFAVFLLSSSSDPSHDVRGAHAQSWRIGTSGDPSFERIDTAFLTERYSGRFSTPGEWFSETPDGELVIPRSPGVVAAAVPAYAVAGAVGADGMSHWPGRITAAAIAAVTILLLLLTLTPLLPAWVCVAGALVVAFTTPIWSVSADGMWTHTLTVCGIAGMAHAAVRDRWLVVGLFGAVAVWGRVHTAVIVAILGLGVSVARRSPRICLLVAATSTAGLAAASLWTYWLYGAWRPSGAYDVAAYAENSSQTLGGPLGTLINQAGMWFSPDRGLFIWTPVAAIAVMALIRHWSAVPDWARWLLMGGLAYTLIQASVSPYMGGDGFIGYRHMLEFLISAVPAATIAMSKLRNGFIVTGALVGYQFATFSIGAWVTGFIPNARWHANTWWRVLREEPVLIAYTMITVGAGTLAACYIKKHRPIPVLN